jgi:hypothetical protein
MMVNAIAKKATLEWIAVFSVMLKKLAKTMATATLMVNVSAMTTSPRISAASFVVK